MTAAEEIVLQHAVVLTRCSDPHGPGWGSENGTLRLPKTTGTTRLSLYAFSVNIPTLGLAKHLHVL